MALGTITKVTGADHVEGNKRVKVRDVQLTSGANYTTGGESLTPAMVGLHGKIDTVQGHLAVATSGGATCRAVSYDLTNQKLQVFTTASAEAASNSDQSGFVVRLRFVGV
jgi:hypothetical protein